MYARPGDTVTLRLTDVASGLAAGLRVKLVDYPEGTQALFTTAGAAGITADPSGTRYTIDLELPDDLAPDAYTVEWHHASFSDPIADDELLLVSFRPPDAEPDPIDVTWRPALADIGALLPRRTKDSNGANPGTFTDDTEPTGEQVELVISMATGHVASRVGETGDLCTTALTSRARGLAALYAAMLVELTFFPEQVGSGRSPYVQYKELFDDGMDALIEGVAENCGEGGGGESIGGDGTLAVAAFPEATPWGTAGW